MRFGVLRFGYENFETFVLDMRHRGYYTINLGDNAQSLAMRHVYRLSGICDEQMIFVNRDTLPSYNGEEAVLIMNGVFPHWSFPVPKRILPVFIGFNTHENVVRDNVGFFKNHEPIGCRDSATTKLMQSYGISAFTSGCLTLAFPARETNPCDTRLFVLYGSWAGRLPSEIIKHIPDRLANTAEFIFHRLPVFSHPLSMQQCLEAEQYEQDLLKELRERATIVLTPLHHVCTPCMAMGIPVILCRAEPDDRFSFLKKLLPIYMPGHFSEIEWNPKPVNIESIRSALLNAFNDQLNRAISRRA